MKFECMICSKGASSAMAPKWTTISAPSISAITSSALPTSAFT